MAQKSKGMRRKTRKKLAKRAGNAGTIRRHLHQFEEGDQVRIQVDSAVQQGMPHPRFHGRVANVTGRRGRGYVIAVKDGGKVKEFAVNAAHLAPVEQ